jgi:predicted TIM-barrel fold metal-dependent hydrolase
VWQDRLAAQFKEAGPTIIENEAGHHLWRYEGQLYPQIGLNAVAGKDPHQYGMDPLRYEDMIPGCYDPTQRVKDMDLDGVHAALCFPSFPGFGGGVFQRAQDKELALACVRAWNDFQLEEWCASAPDRLIPLSLVPTWDPDLAVAEVERVAAKGSRAITFPDAPTSLGLPSFHTDHWERLWDTCEATDTPVCLHFGSGGFVPGFSFSGPMAGQDGAPFAVAIATFGTNSMWSMTDILLSGMLQRHPNLKFMLSEGGIGWIPYMLERIDYTWERHRWYQNLDKETRPSDLFREHIWGCFIDDFHGVAARHEIGVGNILIEVDYPHSDSNWPSSRKHVAENLAEVPDDEAHQIVELNARKLLRFNG